MTAPSSARTARWLVLTREYAGQSATTGGVGRHYASLMPEVAAQGISVEILLSAAELADDPAPLPPGVVVTHTPPPRAARGVLSVLHAALVARRAFATGRHDVIFAPEWRATGTFLPRSAPLVTNLAAGLALIDSVSGQSRQRWVSRASRRLQASLEIRQARRSRGLLPISRAMLDWYAARTRSLPPARVVANCIDVEDVRHAALTAEAPPGWPEGDSPIVLFVGRLSRQKGVLYAADAFRQLAQSMPDVRIVFAGGDGDVTVEPGRCGVGEMLADHADRVVFLGEVRDRSIYRAMHLADVVICPSLWEGFGQVALEVKAAGAPLVVTSGSGFDDFCRDGVDCLMVPPADADALARACARLLTDRALARELTDVAGCDVDGFSPEAIAPRLIEAVDALLPGRAVKRTHG